MKKVILFAWLGSMVWAFGQDENDVDPGSVGSLPINRQGTPVGGKASPFGLPTQKKEKKSSTEKRQFSQEDQIRDILGSLPVTGVIGSGEKVLLGDIVLEEGEYVEDVLPAQTERLLVKEIAHDHVLIEWVEQFRRPNARQMKIPIDMKSRVRILLKGHTESTQKRMGIARNPEEEDQ